MDQIWTIDIRPAAEEYDYTHITESLSKAFKRADLGLSFNKKNLSVTVPNSAIIFHFEDITKMNAHERLVHSLAVINLALKDTAFVVKALHSPNENACATLVPHEPRVKAVDAKTRFAEIIAHHNRRRNAPT